MMDKRIDEARGKKALGHHCKDLGSISSNNLSLQRQLTLFACGKAVEDHGYFAALEVPTGWLEHLCRGESDL